MMLELSFGTFAVQEPAIDGWVRVCEAVAPEDYQDFVSAYEALLKYEAASASGLAGDLAPFMALVAVAPRLLRAVKVFMEACLWNDGKPVPEGTADAATLSDVGKFLEHCMEAKVFPALLEAAKKALGPVSQLLSSVGPGPETSG